MANDMGNIQVGIEFNMVGGRDVVKVTNDVRRFEKEMLKLTQAQRAGAISNKAYQKGVAQLTQRLQKNTGEMIKATKYASQFRKTLAQLDDATLMAARAQNQFGVLADQNTRKFKRFGAVGMQQVGYQVGDFAVQLQGGTNAAVAFGQQGSQLLGIFGPFGAIAGAALAIVTAMVAPMLDASKAAEQFQNKLDKATNALKGYKDELEKAIDLSGDFGDILSAANAKILVDQWGKVGKQSADSFNDNFAAIIRFGIESALFYGGSDQTFGETQGQIAGENFAKAFQGEIRDKNQLGLETLENIELAINERDVQALDDIITGLTAFSATMDTNAAKFLQTLVNIRGEMKELSWAAELVGENNYKAQQEALKLKEEIGEAHTEMLAMAGIDLANPITLAALAASDLDIELKKALATKLKLADFSVTYGMMEGSSGAARMRQFAGRGTTSDKDPTFGETGKSIYDKGTSGRRGGGAGPNLEPMREQFSKLMDRLRGVDPLITKYNQEMAKLDEWHKKGAISSEQLANAQKLLGQELEKNLDPLKKYRQGLEDALDPDKNLLTGLEAMQSALGDFIFDPFEDGVKGMVLQFSNALRRMASEAIAAAIMQKVLGAVGGGGNPLSFLAAANGAVFSGGRVTPFASGGVVSGPTVFPMANGMGLMGEAGPEAVMPLTRDKSGKLGVEATGAAQEAPQIKVVNIDDRASIGDYLESPDGEKVVVNVLRRNGYAR